jgi:hypothetical protein
MQQPIEIRREQREEAFPEAEKALRVTCVRFFRCK